MDSVIFDVDGTLWDSREIVAKTWNYVLKKNGQSDIIVTAETFIPLFGKPVNEITDEILQDMEDGKKRKIEKELLSYENELLLIEPGILYEGIRETISTLAYQYPLFIVSNSDVGYIDAFLRSTDLGSYFKDHICFGDYSWSKGKNIKYIIEKHNLKAPIYVGDMQGDGDACQEAGIPIIYVTYGFGTIKNADYTVGTPKDLIGIINTN